MPEPMEVIRMNFDGPYRTIIVEPLEIPETPQRGEPEPTEAPPRREPVETPEREPSRQVGAR